MGNQNGAEIEHDDDSESSSSQQDVGSESRSPSEQQSIRTGRNHRSGKRSKTHVRLIPLSGSPKSGLSSSLPNMPFPRNNSDQPMVSQGVNHSAGYSRTMDEMTEEEQVKMAQRQGYIAHLPRNTWNETRMTDRKVRECCICMVDFEQDEAIRYLPCMHYYHVDCIDDWLMRSFTCPTCMEPVDAALLSTYGSQSLEDEG